MKNDKNQLLYSSGKEYRRLSKILIPLVTEQDKEKRKEKAQLIDEQMKRLLTSKDCECGGKIVQKRKGTKVAYCEICGARYEARCKKPCK